MQVEAQRKRAEQELKRAQTHKAAMLKAMADLQSTSNLEDSACICLPAVSQNAQDASAQRWRSKLMKSIGHDFLLKALVQSQAID